MTAMLRRLTLKRFRSLRSATVEFDNPTFLVGQNGAGKSNIVDALSLLADAMVAPFAAVMDTRGGIGAVGHRSTSRGRGADVGVRVDIEGLSGVREAMYAFEVRPTQGYDYEVRREQCLCVAEDGTPSWFHRADKFRSNIKTHPAPAPNALALPLVAGDERFEPVAQFLSDIQPYRIDPRTLRELQDPDAGLRLRSDGGNAASVLHQLDPGTRQHLQEVLQTVVPGQVEVKAERVQTKLSLQFTQRGARAAALRLGPHNMSDGTLRAVGLLAAVLQPKLPSMLIVEEPEATIHPGALGTILDILRHAARSTQTVITTHSPDILEARWIEDRHLRIVSWEDGATRVAPTSEATRTALREHLMDAGELLRGNALLGADHTEERAVLFASLDSLRQQRLP